MFNDCHMREQGFKLVRSLLWGNLAFNISGANFGPVIPSSQFWPRTLWRGFPNICKFPTKPFRWDSLGVSITFEKGDSINYIPLIPTNSSQVRKIFFFQKFPGPSDGRCAKLHPPRPPRPPGERPGLGHSARGPPPRRPDEGENPWATYIYFYLYIIYLHFFIYSFIHLFILFIYSFIYFIYLFMIYVGNIFLCRFNIQYYILYIYLKLLLLFLIDR